MLLLLLLLLFIVKMLLKLWIKDPLSSGSSASVMQSVHWLCSVIDS